MATNIQHSTIAGRLTKRPELKQTASGVICCFTIAVNLGSGENKYTEFNECVAHGNVAETIARCFDKGDEIYVFCSNGWRTRERGDRQGTKHFKMEHRVSDFRFLGNKATQPGQTPTPASEAPAQGDFAPTAHIPDVAPAFPRFSEEDGDAPLPF